MTRSWLEFSPYNISRLILACGLVLMLAWNLPGHLSVDSVVQLYEGRASVRQTWAPAIVSWLLGAFDEALAGTGLYVTACSAGLVVALLSLLDLRGKATWLTPAAALGLIVTPQFLLYQGVVWKDVLFANLVVGGFVALAHAARGWSEGRVRLPLAAALACFVLATLARQNGVIIAVAAAAALGWTARGGGLRTALRWGLGGLVLTLALAAVVNVVAEPRHVSPRLKPDKAPRILQHYDVIGAAAHDRSIRLDIIGKSNPAARDLLLTKGVAAYSPARVETLDVDPTVRKALWKLPDAVMGAQWSDIVRNHTGAYVAHRLDVFAQVLATPKLASCLPVHVGVAGPPQMLKDLQLAARQDPQDGAIARYAARFFRTPVYSHLFYAIAAIAMAAVFLFRRDPADGPFAAMLLGALGFAASFVAISVACDYRYLYVLDLAAMTGALYLSLDPGVGRRRRRGG
jgi:hypothetical protein